MKKLLLSTLLFSGVIMAQSSGPIVWGTNANTQTLQVLSSMGLAPSNATPYFLFMVFNNGPSPAGYRLTLECTTPDGTTFNGIYDSPTLNGGTVHSFSVDCTTVLRATASPYKTGAAVKASSNQP